MEDMPAVSSSLEKISQNPPISLALRPETIRHPDKRSKLENDATCGLALIIWVGVKACFSICHDAICTFFLTALRFTRFDGPKILESTGVKARS